jgi:long-chain fatty acid transport protein
MKSARLQFTRKLWLLCASGLVAGLYLSSGTNASALGFRIPNQDAEAIGRGNAFIASADNPSAIYYNPAAITRLQGHELRVGLHNLAINSEYRSLDGSIRAETEDEIAVVPQFYYVYSPEKGPLSYGLGLYAPFGLGLEWPDDVPFRTLAQEGRLTYATVKPVVAWEVAPQFSVAAGPTFNYAKVKLRQGIGFAPDDEFIFKGDGWTVGASAGLLWKPHPKWSFGLSYHSPTTIDFEGTSEARPYMFEEETSGEMDFPQWIAVGIAFHPNEYWVVEVWMDWTDWDIFKTPVLKEESGDTPLPFNWESSFLTGLGATRKFKSGWYASAGYFFSQNSTSEKNFNPIVPDTDLHVGSIGVGYYGHRWKLALAGQIITGPSRLVDDTLPASLIGETANGRYRWFNQSVNVAVGYRF